MKNIKLLLLMLICLLCASCTPANPPSGGNGGGGGTTNVPAEPSDVISSDLPYEETLDSLEGLSEEEILDLSALKNVFDSVGSNYVSKTRVFFNKLAVNRVNIIYNTNFYCQRNTYFNEKYAYSYSNDFVINKAYYNMNSNLYVTKLEGASLEDKLNSTINTSNSQISEEKLVRLDILNSEYVDKYGPTITKPTPSYTKEYFGWTRISENKYKCDREEVIKDFMNICAPGFSNDGTYMTFKYVTVEINPDSNHVLRLRLYASSTQIGKLIDSHTDKEKANWYLLFAEAYISNVNEVSIFALENLYK